MTTEKKACRSRRQRVAALLCAGAALLAAPATAQTARSQYQPGVTPSGAVYYLPKTAVRIAVRVEKTTYTPGEFSRYAERYLRLRDVAQEPSTSYRVIAVEQSAVGVADTSKVYAVEFNAKTSASNVALAENGVLLAVNATPRDVERPAVFKPAPKPAQLNPREYLNEEILAAGSTAKMAELTAQEIYDIRESRNLLTRGQADFMPKDGEQLRLMLTQLDAQNTALTQMFAGTTVRDTTEHIVTFCPSEETDRKVVFRFSRRLGLVDDDDLAGTPYYISIEDLHAVPRLNEEAAAKRKRQNGLYVNVPGRLRSTLYAGIEQLSSAEYPAAQFGHVELLSGDLFNKRYTTHLWLSPLTGAVDRLEAEQPK